MEFRYKAKTATGDTEEGALHADSPEAAARVLVLRNLFPVEVTPVAAGHGWWDQMRVGRVRKLSSNQQAMFARSISDLLLAGVSLVAALGILEEQAEDAEVARRCGRLAESVRQGGSIAHALEEQRGTLPDSLIAVIRAGETGGALEQVVTSIAGLLEEQAELVAKVRQSLIYPAIVSVASLLTLVILFGFLIPRLSVLYVDMGQELPAPTRVLLALAENAQRVGPFVLLAAGGAYLLLRRQLRRSGSFRERVHRWLLGMPRLGEIVRYRETVSFARTLGTLISGGVPVLESMRLTERACGNAFMARQLEAARQRIQQGASVSSAIRGEPSFSGPLITMIEVGERGGNLAGALERAGAYYDRGLQNKLQNFVRFLEPALIFLLAVVVGFIVFSMMLPILELNLGVE